MKHKICMLLLGLGLLRPLYLPAQTEYFNNRYNLYPFNNWDYSKTIVEVEDSYIISGATGGDNNLHNVALTKINKLGEVIWSKYMSDIDNSYSPGYSGSLLKYSEDVYFGAGIARSYTSNWVHDRGLLIKYNSEFDTLWKKEYGEISAPIDTSYLFRNLTFAMDGGIVLTGSWVEYSTGIMNAHSCLIKTDTSGNKYWEHVYGNLPGDVQGYSVISTTDGGYAIGAFQYYHVPPSDETGDPLVIKTDSLGNIEWVKNLGGEYSDSHVMLALSTDGNILAYCTYAVLNNPGSDSYKSPQITKMDNSGATLWNKRYLKPTHFTYPGNIHNGMDGSIIICGKTMISYPKNIGWLMKLSPEGDSIWYRQYNLMAGNESEHMLYDAIHTSDNGYIACGYVHPVLPDTGTQDVWVIKVDSLGCESPTYCWVTMPELMPMLNAGKMQIYPSPANEIFIVILPQSPEGKLQFCDLYGRKIFELDVSSSSHSISVDCSNWRSGVYIGRFEANGTFIAGGKVIIR